MTRLALVAALALASAACRGEADAGASEIPPYIPPAPTEAVSPPAGQAPHDTAAFTQGLVYHAGALYESTGRYAQSSVRKLDPATGEVLRRVDLPPEYFGEGLALLDGKLFQVTWREQTGFVYDVETLERVGTFSYDGEGWGLTTDGTHLVLSDGSDRLRFLDPGTFAVVRTLEVKDAGRFVDKLNELEWVDGEIWANLFQTTRIARIDPATGQVKGWIDVGSLVPPALLGDHEAVPNGIAYDAEGGRLFLTGKLWPVIYQVPWRPAGAAETPAAPAP